jgi:cobalt/nickel transport system permease protein
VDPRSRILAATLFSVVVAVMNRPFPLVVALIAAGICCALSGLSPWLVIRRLIPLNAFMLLLIALMPLAVPGHELWSLGPLGYSREGLQMALTITVKGNAIVLLVGGLVAALPMTTLGHALSHLHVPDKLAHLLLFTVRYLAVLRQEFSRLNAAMRLRGFRPRASMHTYRTYAYLIGMLLVRSLDRSERVMAAMRCRGFRGHFYLLDHFHYTTWDLMFGISTATVIVGLAVLEWQ